MLGLRSAARSHYEGNRLLRGLRRRAVGRATIGVPTPARIVPIVVVARVRAPVAEAQAAQIEAEARIAGTTGETAVAQIVIVDPHVQTVVRGIREIDFAVADFPVEAVVAARERTIVVEVDLLAPTRARSVIVRLKKHIRVARIELHLLSRDGIHHLIEHAEIALPLAADGLCATSVAGAGIVGIIRIIGIVAVAVVVRIVHTRSERQRRHEQDGQCPEKRVDSFHNR